MKKPLKKHVKFNLPLKPWKIQSTFNHFQLSFLPQHSVQVTHAFHQQVVATHQSPGGQGSFSVDPTSCGHDLSLPGNIPESIPSLSGAWDQKTSPRCHKKNKHPWNHMFSCKVGGSPFWFSGGMDRPFSCRGSPGTSLPRGFCQGTPESFNQ